MQFSDDTDVMFQDNLDHVINICQTVTVFLKIWRDRI
jgi:hypothetical protein